MSDYTQIFDDTVSPIQLIGQTTLSNIRSVPGGGGGSNGLGMSAISANWYSSGGVFNPNAPGGTAKSFATGTLYFHPFYVSKTTTYTDIGRLMSTPVAGTSVIGLYNDSGTARPTGAPIANSGNLTNNINTFDSYTFPSPLALSAGIYWCAISVSAATSILICNSELAGRGLGISSTPSSTTNILPQIGWNQAFTYSATLPSVGSLSVTTFAAGGVVGDMFLFMKAQ